MDQESKPNTWNHQITRGKPRGNVAIHWPRQICPREAPEAQAIKANIYKWEYIKLKSFCATKKTNNIVKSQLTGLEKTFTNYAFDKGFISRIYKEHKKLSNKQKFQLGNGQSTWTGIFQRTKYKWPTDTWNILSVICFQKNANKTTMRFYLSRFREVIIYKSKYNMFVRM